MKDARRSEDHPDEVAEHSPSDLRFHAALSPLKLVLMAALHGRVNAAELVELTEKNSELESDEGNLNEYDFLLRVEEDYW
eukprot:CAMPEP_0170501574 /NCGR_PEP_ID=MMETSP0208-20121228/38776_1 /TAXON_ID=197538 /ORGANISM="Strombidium inclinatum, Strain S3" /LENGTH=79 /DNA_ID=CAMNT_0010780213 /DNA_START=282 /DNA_END=518 /DNA_ORIENTATION=+